MGVAPPDPLCSERVESEPKLRLNKRVVYVLSAMSGKGRRRFYPGNACQARALG